MASSVRVRFENVGRSKRTWTAELPDLEEVTLYREVRRHGGLASRGIDCVLHDDGQQGIVLVGGFRVVGTFVVLPAAASESGERT